MKIRKRLELLNAQILNLRNSKEIDLETLGDTVNNINVTIPLLRIKAQRPIKDVLKFIVATLSGVVSGLEEEVINDKQGRAYIRKLDSRIRMFSELLHEMASEDKPETKPKITIHPGVTEISKDIQEKMIEATTDESGLPRQGSSEDDTTLSFSEKMWEEAEGLRLKKQQRLRNWEDLSSSKLNETLSEIMGIIDKLPTTSNKPFLLAKAPVIPTSKIFSLFSPLMLKQCGFSVTTVYGCNIFNSQILLGINTNTLMDGMLDNLKYKKKRAESKEKVDFYKEKVSRVRIWEKQIAEYKEELEEFGIVPPEGFGDDKKRAQEARDLRTRFLEKSIAALRAKIERFKVEHEEDFKNLEKFIAIHDEVKAEARIVVGKSEDYSDKVVELADKALTAINQKVKTLDNLVLVTKKGIVRGQMTYFWVMPDRVLGSWTAELAFTKMKFEIFDWSLPEYSQTKTESRLVKELTFHQDLTEYILRLRRKEFSKKTMLKKVEKFLSERRKKIDDYIEVITKIWKESKEVLLERKLVAE